MADPVDANKVTKTKDNETWQLDALTEALGDLSLTITDSLSVGRGSDNDMVLGSKEVSRNHALLSVLNEQLYVKDLNSSNGTFINDKRIESNQSKRLQANDTLGFASFAFKVIASTASADTITSSGIDSADINSTDAKRPVVDSVLADTEKDAEATIEALSIPVDSEISVHEQIDSANAATPVDAVSSNTADIRPVTDSTTTVSADDKVATPLADSPVVDSSTKAQNEAKVVKEAVISEEAAINKKTMISDGLATSDSLDKQSSAPVTPSMPSATVSTPTNQETTMSSDNINKTDAPREPNVTQPTRDETLTTEPPVKNTAAHQEPVVAPEHDKTTKTTLQEEADPDVLRAKQAATAQFSGTANLGQGRDVGTQGNNAMDQAIDNPASTDRKPSGGWFIWVFIAIIIIGLALWLFNMGGA